MSTLTSRKRKRVPMPTGILPQLLRTLNPPRVHHRRAGGRFVVRTRDGNEINPADATGIGFALRRSGRDHPVWRPKVKPLLGIG